MWRSWMANKREPYIGTLRIMQSVVSNCDDFVLCLYVYIYIYIYKNEMRTSTRHTLYFFSYCKLVGKYPDPKAATAGAL